MSKPPRYSFDGCGEVCGSYYDAQEADEFIATLEADAQRLREAIRGLLREHPVGVDCQSFHHDKRDLHMLGGVCPPFGRYIKAINDAYHALDGKPEPSND